MPVISALLPLLMRRGTLLVHPAASVLLPQRDAQSNRCPVHRKHARNRLARSDQGSAVRLPPSPHPWTDMTPLNEDNLPDELQDIARRLREERREASPLELDRIKTTAMARARSRSFAPRGGLRSRLVVALTSLALV